MPRDQIACNWSSNLVAADCFSMKSQTTSISSFVPDSKPSESWKIKLLPLYVIPRWISCIPLWQFDPTGGQQMHSLPFYSPQLMVLNMFQKVLILHLDSTKYEKVFWAFVQLTLVVYNNRFCSLCYTTNLLKDGCLACISSSYDKNAKMGTSVLHPEMCDICLMCYKEAFNFWWRRGNIFNLQGAGAAICDAITDVFGMACMTKARVHYWLKAQDNWCRW